VERPRRATRPRPVCSSERGRSQRTTAVPAVATTRPRLPITCAPSAYVPLRIESVVPGPRQSYLAAVLVHLDVDGVARGQLDLAAPRVRRKIAGPADRKRTEGDAVGRPIDRAEAPAARRAADVHSPGRGRVDLEVDRGGRRREDLGPGLAAVGGPEDADRSFRRRVERVRR
jgi:hypothetical protein